MLWRLATLSLLLLACSTSNGIRWVDVSSAEFGETWPFAMTSGSLGCLNPGAVIFSPSNRRIIYTVNGLAMTRAEIYDWHDMRPIWKDRVLSDWPADVVSDLRRSGGGKVNIGPIIDHGLELCSNTTYPR